MLIVLDVPKQQYGGKGTSLEASQSADAIEGLETSVKLD